MRRRYGRAPTERDPDAALPDAERTTVTAVYQDDPKGKAQVDAGRDVLLYAVRFPAILFVVFGLIALYFRSRGGYKPIDIHGKEEALEAEPGM